jgi:hypothetical protein
VDLVFILWILFAFCVYFVDPFCFLCLFWRSVLVVLWFWWLFCGIKTR